MSDVREMLSALIDREPVDPAVLGLVLEDPANRALLVEFVRLRAAIQAEEQDEVVWRPHSPSAMATRSTWLRRVAAVLLLLGAGAGAGVWAQRLNTEERPPEPTRIVRLQPVNR